MPIIKDVIFCDYVSQDITGKHNCMGIYFGDITFPEKPDFLPAIMLCVDILPTEEIFTISVVFDDPVGRCIVRSNISFEFPASGTPVGNMIISFQVPPISNPVLGTYAVRFLDDHNNSLAEFTKILRVGQPQQIAPRLHVTTSVGDDFKAEFGL